MTPDYDVIDLPGNLNWLYRPWLAGRMQFYELADGTYDLADIAEMNEALDVESENMRRAHEAAAKRQK